MTDAKAVEGEGNRRSPKKKKKKVLGEGRGGKKGTGGGTGRWKKRSKITFHGANAIFRKKKKKGIRERQGKKLEKEQKTYAESSSTVRKAILQKGSGVTRVKRTQKNAIAPAR